MCRQVVSLKKVLVVLLIVILLFGGGILGSLYVYHGNANDPLVHAAQPLTVNVREGESLYPVVDRLAGEGLLKNAWLTKLYYRLSGLDLEIEPGRHEIPAHATLKEMVEALASENLDNVRVTIPEGFTIANMASRFEESGLLTGPEFIRAAENFPAPDYVPALGERRYRMEGYLKPDTYVFTKGTAGEAIIKKMSDEFRSNLEAILNDLDRQDLTPAAYDEIINKAAMIERETNNPEERPIVASVIENRLAIDMKLQLDATILYALGVDSKRVTYDDMAYESPFSTYHVKGLPAGPICSPSSESIRAVLEPATTDYIYYVLNPQTGKHFFTDSYDEFLVRKKQFSGQAAPVVPPGTQTTQPVDTQPENPYEGPVGFPFEIVPEGTEGTGSVTTPDTTPGSGSAPQPLPATVPAATSAPAAP